jgi:hypothetical protein
VGRLRAASLAVNNGWSRLGTVRTSRALLVGGNYHRRAEPILAHFTPHALEKKTYNIAANRFMADESMIYRAVKYIVGINIT